MEERLSFLSPEELPPGSKDSTKVQSSGLNPGTYVVRIPKDQVYRFPNSENARIAELHKSSPPKKAKTSRCCLCCVLFSFVFFILLILLGGVLGGLFSLLFSPKDPEFSIEQFKLVTKPHPKYDITLKVHNSNPDVGIIYKDSSHVKLSLDGKEIANGDYPALNQDPRDTTSFGVALKGSKTVLPKKVEESVKSDRKNVPVTFSLAVQALARMEMGFLRSGTMKFDASCKIKLDTLANFTKIVSQQCQTKRH